MTLPSPVSAWTQVGPATNTTIQDSSGAIWFNTTDTTGTVRGLIQPAPAVPWTRTFAFLPSGFAAVADNSAGCGLLLTDGNAITAGKQLWWGIDRKGSSSPRLSLYEFTNGVYTSVVNTASYNTNAPTSGLLYLRVSETGGGTPTRTLSIGVDGRNFSTFYTGPATTWITTADYGFACNPVPTATDSNAATLVGVQ
ncbi:MAG TPA: hypothetical protein VG675_01525 [Bryobacteraceae bacterium]|nr:hypothetical protein [Bryobacteraceae bacterium]